MERRDNISSSDIEYIMHYANIDMTKKKYHIFDKSPFDQLNTGFQDNHYFFGLFKNMTSGHTIVLDSSTLQNQYDKYKSIKDVVQSLSNVPEGSFTVEQVQKLKQLKPFVEDSLKDFKEMTLREYIEMIYEQITFE